MADNNNSSNPTIPGPSQTPADDGSNTQPEWTPERLMAMVNSGQVLNPEQRQRLEAYLAELRAMREFAQELAELQNPNEAPSKSKKRRRRRHETPDDSGSSDPSSSSEADNAPPRRKRRSRGFKISNVQTLKHTASLRRWGDWKLDIQRVFYADPRTYKEPHSKVLRALDHVDNDLKSLWASHLVEHPEDEKSWDVFLPWTKSNIAQGIHSETTLYDQYQGARQRPEQSPREFNTYLVSLERDLAPKTEKERAMALYTRLDQNVKDQFRLSNISTDITRSEMVDAAQNIWEGLKGRKQPYRSPQASEASSSSKPKQDPKSNQHPRQQKNDAPPPKTPAREKAEREGLCFRCGSSEHRVADCPEPSPATVKAVSKAVARVVAASCSKCQSFKDQYGSDSDVEANIHGF